MTAKLIIVEQCYWQTPGSPGLPASYQHETFLDSDDEPYIRNVLIGEEWEKLDCGWIREASCVYIRNPREWQTVIPSQAKKLEMESHRLEIAQIVPVTQLPAEATEEVLVVIAQVPYDHSTRISFPPDVNTLRIRCINGQTRYAVYVYPR